MPPDEPNDEERLEQLPGDEETPFRPAPPSRDDTRPADDAAQATPPDDTHPVTDTDVDQQELYDEGVENPG